MRAQPTAIAATHKQIPSGGNKRVVSVASVAIEAEWMLIFHTKLINMHTTMMPIAAPIKRRKIDGTLKLYSARDVSTNEPSENIYKP